MTSPTPTIDPASAPLPREPDYADGFEGMLLLWNAESDRERNRQKALEMADLNRETHSKGTRK